MKKFLLIVLSLTLCLSMPMSTLAVSCVEETTPYVTFTNSDGNLEQHSMRPLTESELQDLPNDVLEVISPLLYGADVTPYGVNPPDTSNVWDLSTENYNFKVDMRAGNVYSNYVFTGQENSVYLTTYDISGNSGHFVGTVYAIRDGGEVFVDNGYLYRGTSSSIFISGLSSDDYIYFYISVNDGVRTLLDEEGSYLSMYSK